MDDYTIELAKETMEWVDGENPRLDDFFMAKARTIAAIAQAEQLKRIADSLEKLEQRPVLQLKNLSD